MKNIYELGYWLRIEVNINEELERIKKILVDNSAEVIFEENPKKRSLAYPIKKERLGYFGYLIFKISNREKVENIKKDLSKIKNILRYLIIKREAISPKEQLTVNESK